ncbi:glycosyltransferase [Mycobacterium paragordonae]|nr:glycosyltransferase [Mycobacterium paragordonae]
MPGPITARPALCLNMIVRNEAHVIQELLDSVATHISSWVIVDTGSDDGTQDLIRRHMARLGIPGELHERAWRNFADNRNEALELAQGHGDYIWVMDADDPLVGEPDLTRLDADIYYMRYVDRVAYRFWRPLLFRDGLRVRYEGVIHEYPAWDDPYVAVRLEGNYHIEYRQLGARSASGQKYAQDRDLLLAEVKRNPQDERSVFLLAQTYFSLDDFANARKWYERRAEMGGSAEQVYLATFQIAQSMDRLGAPFAEVQNAYLKAWELRPTRAEALWSIACLNRVNQRYHLGYLFAKRASELPFPEEDSEMLYTRADIYSWRAMDEQAVCASYIGRVDEAFMLCRRMLAVPDLPDEERVRIARNRDALVQTMLDAACQYPEAAVQSVLASRGEGELVVSLVAGPDRDTTERALNSFLQCCTDVSQVGHFLAVDTGLSAHDRGILLDHYEFLNFVPLNPRDTPGAHFAHLRQYIKARYWLHLDKGWRFFAPENLITRLTAVLQAEPLVVQVGINVADAASLTGTSARETAVSRAPEAGRYLLTDTMANGPAMYDTTRLNRAGATRATDPDPIKKLGRQAAAAGLRFASLDEVLCITAL